MYLHSSPAKVEDYIYCFLYFSCVINLNDKCDRSCNNSYLIERCEHSIYQKPYMNKFNSLRQKNAYCVLCKERGISAVKCDDIGYTQNPDDDDPVRNPISQGGYFSLSLLVDFDLSKGVYVGEGNKLECEVGYYVLDSECVPVTCPEGFMHLNNECVEEIRYLQLDITVCSDLQFTSSVEQYYWLSQLNNHNLTKVFVMVLADSSQFDTSGITYTNISVAALEVQFNYNNTLFVKVHYGISVHVNASINNATQLEVDDLVMLSNEKMLEVTSEEMNVITRDVQMCSKQQTYQQQQSKPCKGTWKPVNNNTYLMETLNASLSNNMTIATMDNYIITTDGMIHVCDEVDPPVLDNNDTLGLVTIILSVISVICLLIRIILQWMVASFQTTAGRLQFQLVLAMFFAYLLLLSSTELRPYRDVCTAVGVALHYMFLATFVWMNCIAFHSWRVFRPTNLQRADDKKRPPLRLCIFGWGIPLVLSALALVTDLTVNDSNIKPDFNEQFCWFSNRLSLFIFFGIPFIVAVCGNVVLYSMTAYTLYRSFQKQITYTIGLHRYHFKIYMRLFVLMGITWVVGIASAFYHNITLSYIFVVLNSLHGVFMFVAFVCSKRVWRQIKTGKPFLFMTSRMKSSTSSTPVDMTRRIHHQSSSTA